MLRLYVGYLQAKYILYAQHFLKISFTPILCTTHPSVAVSKVRSFAKLLNLQPSKNGEEDCHRDKDKLIAHITAIGAEFLGDGRDVLLQNSQ